MENILLTKTGDYTIEKQTIIRTPQTIGSLEVIDVLYQVVDYREQKITTFIQLEKALVHFNSLTVEQ